MSDDLTDETTVPRARELARTALAAIGFSEDETGISDLIADLMHLADDPEVGAEDGSEGVLHDARRHYEAERDDEDVERDVNPWDPAHPDFPKAAL